MSNKRPLGGEWLKQHYNLGWYSLTHCSFLGSNSYIELTSKGNIEQIYGPSYAVSQETPLHHVEFYLKYDDLNLDFLEAVFQNIDTKSVVDFIEKRPSGIYSRKIGFLYEFITKQALPIKKPIGGNYVDLIDTEYYITGTSIKNARWRINNNLLGESSYCPIIRRKKELDTLIQIDIASKIARLQSSYPPEIFQRATQFLYKKETKSSFEIEKETPTQQRMERFIELLRKAGSELPEMMLTEKRLTDLQGAIIDPRFVESSFRNYQNYVGQSLPNGQQLFHYICPPPEMINDLMVGIQATAIKTKGIHPGIRAAIISFGFVFIHPFIDGNGRIHRFLIHDVLHQDKMVPDTMIIPVSAHMLAHIKEYDTVLEKYSVPLMQRIRYDIHADESITITNSEEVSGYFRFPDLTEHAIYLVKVLNATLDEDMPGELLFLQRYDEVKKNLQEIVDMPDRLLNLMIIYLHQNNGIFPKRRRDIFKMLKDEEISAMQNAYRIVFELNEVKNE